MSRDGTLAGPRGSGHVSRGLRIGRSHGPAPPRSRPRHLDRLAVVYVRQSSPQQVLEHQESTARQYALADRAVALGWPADRVLVIDEDQGRAAGASRAGPGSSGCWPRSASTTSG